MTTKTDKIRRRYDRIARVYNLLEKPMEYGFSGWRSAMLDQARGNTLEVGVGTGKNIPYYPDHVHLTGIDFSDRMISVAKKNYRESDNLSLQVMDAQSMSFADNSFDMVAVMYVVTVVPEPEKMMAEIQRVCNPGGDIFVVNHFSNPHLIPRMVETVMLPFKGLLGFRPRFSLEAFLAQNPLQVVETCPVNMLGYWTLIHARNAS